MGERAAEDWLIRYLVVLVVGVVAMLALLYGLVLEWSPVTVLGSVVALVLVSVLVARDLRSWRAA
ncbi:hypothetical protein HUG10_04215 [Halorarum halophilum]|uniref:Uncharacterized protein n=1 Tax=Halorarum halophilum TaxID=2743090 RepID=A0A7D5GYE5_9EURY|nr:hypothetical protein [Halobaculum halophilum]QLG26793.1 hypothetical protein HUG10_04215 [Halobaculum halophilum]